MGVFSASLAEPKEGAPLLNQTLCTPVVQDDVRSYDRV